MTEILQSGSPYVVVYRLVRKGGARNEEKGRHGLSAPIAGNGLRYETDLATITLMLSGLGSLGTGGLL